MAKEDKKPPEAAAGKPKKKKMALMAGVAIAVMAIGGGAAWYFMKGKHAGDEKKPEAVLSAQPIFVPLDPFTVNLQRDQGDQVLQVGLSLKFFNADLNEKIKNDMPEVRSSLLLLLSSKHASELMTVEGKRKLANEIITAVNAILGMPPEPVRVAAPAPVPAPPADPAATPPAETPAGGAAPGLTPAPAAPVVPPEPPTSGKNRDWIVDVLFTSFIIQ